MTSNIPTVWIGGDASAGRDYQALVAGGPALLTATGASVIKLYYADLVYMPAAVLQGLVALCNATGTKLAVEYYAVTPKQGEIGEGLGPTQETFNGFTNLAATGGSISDVDIDEALFRAGDMYGWSDAEIAASVAQKVAAIRSIFPNATFSDIEPSQEPSNLGRLAAWFAALEANGVKLTSYTPDIRWDAAATLQDLENLSSLLVGKGIGMTIIFDGNADDESDAAWSATAERRLAEVASDPNIDISIANVQTWQSFPTSEGPVNQLGSMANVASVVKILYALYRSGVLGTLPVSDIKLASPAKVMGASGSITPVSGLSVSLGLSDLVGGAKLAVIITGTSVYLSAVQHGSGTVQVTGEFQITLTGDKVDLDAELSTLTIEGTVASSDSLDVEVFDASGRVADASIAVSILSTLALAYLSSPTIMLALSSDTGVLGDDITSVTQPTLSGSAVAGGTVSINVDGTVVGTTVANGSGVWNYKLTSALVAGAHEVSASLAGAAGGHSAASTLALAIDAAQPPAPTITLVPSSDSGVPSDDITSVTQPTVAGTAVAGGTVSITVNGKAVGTTVANSSGAWNYRLTSALAVGTYAASASVTDVAGNTSQVSVLSIIINASAQNTDSPDPLFDQDWFEQQYPAYLASDLTPYNYFLQIGWKLGDNPDPWFNTNYYLNQNPDVAAASMNPLIHYELYGWKEGRNPSSLFDTRAYQATHSDAAITNPLLQFISDSEKGINTGTPAAPQPAVTTFDPLVDAQWCYSQYPTLVTQGLTAYTNYMTTGWKLGHNPDPWFDTSWYLAEHPSVALSSVNPLTQFETTGWKEGWDPSPSFSVSQYLANNPDVAAAGMDPLLHYIEYGLSEGREIYSVAGEGVSSPTIQLDPSTGSGVAGDQITHVNRPLLEGEAMPGGTITILVDSVFMGTAIANNTGWWSYVPLVPLKIGDHYITVYVTNSAGVASATVEMQLTISATTPAAPTIAIGHSSDVIVPGVSITTVIPSVLTGSAIAGGIVAIIIDGMALGTTVAGANGVWSYDLTSALAPGVHIAVATVTDLAGNCSAVSTPCTLTTAVTSPAAPTIVLAPLSTSGLVGQDTTSVTQPALSGMAQAGSIVSISLDGDALTMVTADSNGSWSFCPSASLALGTHNITAYATTSADISSPTTSIVINIVPLDDSSPDPLFETTWFATQYPGVLSSQYTPYNYYMTTGWRQGENPDPWFDTSWYLGQHPSVAQSGVNPLTQFETTGWKEGWDPSPSFSVSQYLANNPDVAAAGMDPLLHYVEYGHSEARKVSPTAPTITLAPSSDTGVPGDDITSVTQPALTGAAVAGGRVSIKVDGTAVGTTVANSSRVWNYNLASALTPGHHTVSASVTDVAGNQSVASTFALTIDTTPPPAPTITLAPSSDTGVLGDDITSVTQPSLTGAAVAGGRVSIKVDGTAVGTAVANSSGVWVYNLASMLTTGQHTISASVTDVAGNQSVASTFALTIDTTPPPAPTITLAPSSDTGVPGDDITSVTQPSLTGAAVAGGRVSIKVDGTAVGTSVANSSGVWVYNLASMLTTGQHTISASVTDVAGNQSIASTFALTIDTTPPLPPTITLAPSSDTGVPGDDITSVTKPSLTGAAVAGETVSIKVDRTAVGTAVANSSGVWSYNLASALTTGQHTISASVTDLAGNTSQLNLLSINISANAQNTDSPDPLFDQDWFEQQYPAFLASGLTSYNYFLQIGWKLGDNPDPWFNTDYYLNQNPDVAASGMNPLIHYELYGWKEGRDPSSLFDTRAYQATHPDAANTDPLLQFTLDNEKGVNPGTPPAPQPVVTTVDPLMDAGWYYGQYPSLVTQGLNAYTNYMTTGWELGYNPDPWFDTSWYLAEHPSVALSGVNPLTQFETTGWKEGWDPSPSFSVSKYLTNNTDVAAAGMDPLLHYIEYGLGEGREIYPSVNLTVSGSSEIATITGHVAGAPSSGNYSVVDLSNIMTIAKPGITFLNASAETTVASAGFGASQVNEASASTLGQALDAAIAQDHNTMPNTGVLDWLQYGGNTYIVESINPTSKPPTTHAALSPTDAVVRLSGLIDLSRSSFTGHTWTFLPTSST